MSVLLFTGIACDRPAATVSPPAQPDRITVVASACALGDLARQVGENRVNVAWWVESGQQLSGFQPSSEQMEQMRRAAAIITNGTAEGPFTGEFSDSFGDRRLIRLDAFAPPDSGPGPLWLDPTIAKQLCHALCDRLAAVDSVAAEAYRDRTLAAVAEIDGLIAEWKPKLAGLRGITVATIGNDYSALARHLEFVVEPLSSTSAAAMDDKQLADLRDGVRKARAKLVLVESDTPPAVLGNMQSHLDVPVVRIDSLGSSSSQGRDTYDKLMRFNYQQLEQGLVRMVR